MHHIFIADIIENHIEITGSNIAFCAYFIFFKNRLNFRKNTVVGFISEIFLLALLIYSFDFEV